MKAYEPQVKVASAAGVKSGSLKDDSGMLRGGDGSGAGEHDSDSGAKGHGGDSGADLAFVLPVPSLLVRP